MAENTDILQLPAGPELDKLVAEQVMGLSNVRQGWLEFAYGDTIVWEENDDNHPRLKPALLHDEDRIVPSYSSAIHAAWKVVEVLKGGKMLRYDVRIDLFHRALQVTIFDPYAGKQIAQAEADTAAVAICRAALLASPTLS
jgi:Phage ABA sandwich domain